MRDVVCRLRSRCRASKEVLDNVDFPHGTHLEPYVGHSMPRWSSPSRCIALLLAVWWISSVGGCAWLNIPRIDPSGRRIFLPETATPADYRPMPVEGPFSEETRLTLSPVRTVAPVGSEVVLLAGVLGPDGYLRTNERIEWSLVPGGVGEFVEVDPGSFVDWLVLDFTRPRRLSNTFAVGSTSRQYLRLTRGTPIASDDICVLRGQTWVTVAAATEGTSYVTAFAPGVTAWNLHKQTAVIHWIDAQWRFPPPAINPAGTTHVFTTTVTRHTDQSPHAGWIVRYEIVGGPPAGFAPDGAQAIEIATDDAGQASAEIFQKQAAGGTNQIKIEIIRPEGLPGQSGQRLVVGSGSTSKTWSAPEISVSKTGPAVAAPGATVDYLIQITNPGDLPAQGVTVTDEVPTGMELIETTPPGEIVGNRIRWTPGTLSPRQTQTFRVSLRAVGSGAATSCAEVSASEGLRARDCVTTSIQTAPVSPARIDVQILGPNRATVGERVDYELVVTNRGSATATDLLIKDRFDDGLKHEVAESPIERDLGDLDPGESRRIGVSFQAVAEGRQCQKVEIVGSGGVLASAESCLTVASPQTLPTPSQPSGEAPLQPPAQPAETPAGRPSVGVRVGGPPSGNVGQVARFSTTVTNTGPVPLTRLRIVSDLDAGLQPAQATEGYQLVGDDLVWTIERLESGKAILFEVVCRCQKPGPELCNRVRVTTQQGARAEGKACLEVRGAGVIPSLSGLTMSVADLRDPVAVGKEVTYEIRVHNAGQTAHNNVTLSAVLPPGTTLVPLKTSGPSSFDLSGRQVEFEPVGNVRVGETLNYRVRVLAQEKGDVTFQALVQSQSMQQPMRVEEGTQIVGQ